MKTVKYTDIEPVEFDSDVVKGVEGRVLIGKDDGAENFCMRVFEIAANGHTPRDSHEWEHEIFTHLGKGEVLLKDKWHPMSPGTAIFIPENIEHQMKNTNDEPLVVVCLVPLGVSEL